MLVLHHLCHEEQEESDGDRITSGSENVRRKSYCQGVLGGMWWKVQRWYFLGFSVGLDRTFGGLRGVPVGTGSR